MNAFVILGALAAAVEYSQHGGEVGVTLKSTLGDLPAVGDKDFTKWAESARSLPRERVFRGGRSERYMSTRTPDNCTFPLEIAILQDLTDSFSDNIAEMKNVQLKQMVTSLSQSHPGSRFTVVGFQDKPIYPLGDRDDACWLFTSDFTSEVDAIYDAYAKFTSYGGADAPENQFGALLATLGTTKINWSSTQSEYARLVVVVTDAGPHHAADGSKPADGTVLAPWTGPYSDDQAQDLCLNHHYPSAQLMYDQIVAKQTYVAALVFDGDWANGWAANEWKTFNRFLAQPEGFVEPDAEDSSQFWAKLSSIIDELENIECTATTTAAPPPAPTTAAPTPAPTTTTTPAPECKPELITDGPCVPTPENCNCMAEVLIELGKKPDTMNLVADEKVLVAY